MLRTSLGGVVDVDLLATDVFLDDFRVLNHVLADAHLFFGNGSLLHDDLFFGNGDADLGVSDLGLGGLALYGDAIDCDLLVAGRYLHPLAVGFHALANIYGASLALEGSDPELLLGPLNPQLVLTVQVAARLGDTLLLRGVLAELTAFCVAHGHAGVLVTVILTVSTAFVRSLRGLQPIVGVDLVL